MNFQKICPFVLLATAVSMSAAFASGKPPKGEPSDAEKVGQAVGKAEKKAEHGYKKHVEKPIKEIIKGVKEGEKEQKGKASDKKPKNSGK